MSYFRVVQMLANYKIELEIALGDERIYGRSGWESAQLIETSYADGFFLPDVTRPVDAETQEG